MHSKAYQSSPRWFWVFFHCIFQKKLSFHVLIFNSIQHRMFVHIYDYFSMWNISVKSAQVIFGKCTPYFLHDLLMRTNDGKLLYIMFLHSNNISKYTPEYSSESYRSSKRGTCKFSSNSREGELVLLKCMPWSNPSPKYENTPTCIMELQTLIFSIHALVIIFMPSTSKYAYEKV